MRFALPLASNLILYTRLNAVDLRCRTGVKIARINKGLYHLQKSLPQTFRPGTTTGLDQHLPLPQFAPPHIIALISGKGHHERASRAIGTQAHIHAIQKPLWRHLCCRTHNLLTQSGEKLLIGHRLCTICIALGTIDKHQIDIRTKIKLHATQLAQPKNRKFHGLSIGISRHTITRLQVGQQNINQLLQTHICQNR